jgi:hypothetical protein
LNIHSPSLSIFPLLLIKYFIGTKLSGIALQQS